MFDLLPENANPFTRLRLARGVVAVDEAQVLHLEGVHVEVLAQRVEGGVLGGLDVMDGLGLLALDLAVADRPEGADLRRTTAA